MWSPVDGAPPSQAATTAADVSSTTASPAVQPTSAGTLLTVPTAGVVGGMTAVAGDVDGGLQLTTAAASTSTTPKLAECRKSSPKLKIPPMFQMDSGSSYESYEATDSFIQLQTLQVCLCLSSIFTQFISLMYSVCLFI